MVELERQMPRTQFMKQVMEDTGIKSYMELKRTMSEGGTGNLNGRKH